MKSPRSTENFKIFIFFLLLFSTLLFAREAASQEDMAKDSCAESLLSDIDGDGTVGVSDLLQLLGAWGPNAGHPADIDGDGSVSVTDLLILLANWGPVICEWSDPYPSEIIDASGLNTPRHGIIQFVAKNGNVLTAYTYRATGFNPTSGKIWFVQHGANRTASSYLNASAPVAERADALAIAIEFNELDYPGSQSFAFGVGTDGTPSGRNYDPTQWLAPEDYTFSEVEHLFEAIRIAFAGEQAGYYLFGHSAGSQFTHRLLSFLQPTPILRAVAANSGWYTLPSDGGASNSNFYMPYGLQGSPLDNFDMAQVFEDPLTILVGENDTIPSNDPDGPRNTPQANFQGMNRLERGQFYYDFAQEQASAIGSPFNWLFNIVPGAKHDKDEMIASAGWYLFEREEAESPCTPTPAAAAGALRVNEIHADPASGEAGDANNDGVRQSNEDEFIELVNTGDTSICLTGWILTDAENPERHRFPIGSKILPGKALVVFGGGVPTGTFGETQIQWAAFGRRLNLNNAGDVIRLYDHNGEIFHQISWGTCDGFPCANEHLPFSLGINQSINRWPELTGPWTPHQDIPDSAGALYSPGTFTNGQPF